MILRLPSRLPDAPKVDSRPPLPADDRRQERGLLRLGVAGVVLTFVTLGMLYAFRMPIYRPADEASHVGYARELSHGHLPTIETPIPSDGDQVLAKLLRRRDDMHRTIWTANHPPLYYALAAVPLRIGSAVAHPLWGVLAARALSVGLAAVGLVAVAYVVLQLVPDRPGLAVAAAGLVGLLPSFPNIMAVVYNDSLAFLTSTVAMAAVVVFLIRGPSAARLTAVAATAGLAALTRASGLVVAGIAGLAVLIGVWRASQGGVLRRFGRAVVWAGAVGVAVAAVAGWFYLRSLVIYHDITGSAAICRHFTYCDPDKHGSFWHVFSNHTIWLLEQRRLWTIVPSSANPTWRLWLIQLVPLAGLLLAGARWLSRKARDGGRPVPGRAVAVALLVLLLGLLQLSVIGHISSGGNLHVRYIFPGLVTLGLILAVGLAALPGGRRGLPATAMLLALGAATLWESWRYLNIRGADPGRGPLLFVVPLLLVGLGLQRFALWRLRPAGRRPGPPTPAGQSERRTAPSSSTIALS
jgi:hypothetical protein